MRDIKTIVIHCSASTWGSFEIIDSWHKKRDFTKVYSQTYGRDIYCGYHYIVMNQFSTSTKNTSSPIDGKVVEARPLSQRGCHVSGMNTGSIGICYIGFSPTPMQLQSLLCLVRVLVLKFNVRLLDVIGHYECYSRLGQTVVKTCPNFDMESFRNMLQIV